MGLVQGFANAILRLVCAIGAVFCLAFRSFLVGSLLDWIRFRAGREGVLTVTSPVGPS